MATVQQIIERLAREDPLYGIYRPGLGTSRTEVFEAVQPNGEPVKKWIPNRKVVSGIVAGAVAWVSVKLLGVELDADTSSAVTLAVMGLISYLVPLKED